MAAYNNWFTTMRSRYNGDENFITALRPEQIQRDAKNRIFREMARGQIDYIKEIKYFKDPKFLDNLIVIADELTRESTLLYNSLTLYDQMYPGDVNIRNLSRKYSEHQFIYGTILTKLQQMKFYDNIGVFSDLAAIICGRYKNIDI